MIGHPVPAKNEGDAKSLARPRLAHSRGWRIPERTFG
jgi:hypothetical protein